MANDNKNESGFLLIDRGEIHLKAKPKTFAVISGVALAFSAASFGSKLIYSDMEKAMESDARKCVAKIEVEKQCSVTEISRMKSYNNIQSKKGELDRSALFWLGISGLLCLPAVLPKKQTPKNKNRKSSGPV